MKKVKKLIAVLICMAMILAVLPAVTAGAEEPSEEFEEVFKYYGMQSATSSVHKFSKIYTGEVRIEFDLVVNTFSDGVIAFSNNSGIFGPEAIAIHTKGSLTARNGNGSGSASQESFYTPEFGKTYHFSITTDTAKHIWSGTMTTPNGETVTVANNYGYRTNQDSIDRIIMLRNTSTSAYVDDVELSNLKIYGNGKGKCGDNLTWTLDGGTLTISGTGDMWNYSSYTFEPWFDNRSSINSVIVENGVTRIGGFAFSNCSRVTSITIPDSVKSIGDSAFVGCAMTSITIPDSVKSISYGAFYGCDSLTSINVSENNSSYTSVGGVLFAKDMSELIQYPAGKADAEYKIPYSVKSIGDSAFSCCENLESVTIPDSVKSIGDSAFVGCAMTSITIPDSVTSIGESAFQRCERLKTVNIPDSVKSISNYAFYECYNLESITIPDSVTSIGVWTFGSCYGLESITIPDSVTSIGEGVFSLCSSLKDVYYGGSEEAWAKISIGGSNDCLTGATIHFGSAATEPKITDAKVSAGYGTITVAVKTENTDNAKLFAVGYGNGGEYVNKANVNSGTAQLPSEGVKTVKVFCWESLGSMKPLCEAKTVTVQQ